MYRTQLIENYIEERLFPFAYIIDIKMFNPTISIHTIDNYISSFLLYKYLIYLQYSHADEILQIHKMIKKYMNDNYTELYNLYLSKIKTKSYLKTILSLNKVSDIYFNDLLDEIHMFKIVKVYTCILAILFVTCLIILIRRNKFSLFGRNFTIMQS